MGNPIPFEVFAWIGPDELGSGEVGIKQYAVLHHAVVRMPLVSIHRQKLQVTDITRGLQRQADQFNTTIRLVRCVVTEELAIITPRPNE